MAFIGETSLTYEEVHNKAAALAAALQKEGLRPGDPVAVATANRSGFYTSFAGCFAAGFPVVVIDPAAGYRELWLMLGKAAPAALIADEEVLEGFADDPDNRLPRVVLRVAAPSAKTRLLRWPLRSRKRAFSARPSLDDIFTSGARPVAEELKPESPAYIMFTSGTTSNPKAVVVSRSALQHHVDTLSSVFGYGQNARLLTYLPLHHTDGLIHGVAASLLKGMTVIHPGPFSATTDIEKTLREKSISHFLGVPTILSIILRTHGDRAGLFQYEEFRSVISTAGHLDEKLWKDFQENFGVRISNFYGMTETVSGSLYCGPADGLFRFGTVGKPADTDVRIVDQDGAQVAPEIVGELQISGRHLMTGYLDDDEATQAAIVDGWLSTGDLFSQDADGFFRIVGRKKNIIKRGGITIYPEDIQRMLLDMPGILEVEVVGLPDDIFEEIIVVCAVTEAGISPADVHQFCRQQLAAERYPDRVELMDQLPKGPSGKARRKELIAILKKSADSKTRPETSLRNRVISVAAETFSADSTELDEASSPDTVDGWDSFAGMEFVIALEKEFGMRLSPRDIMRMRNLGQALEIVSDEMNNDAKMS